MLKRKWLNLVLDVNFMTLHILKVEYFFMFLEFIIYLWTSSQNFVENLLFSLVQPSILFGTIF